MVVEDVGSLVSEIGAIGLWLKTAGMIFVLWVVFDVANYIINRKRMARLKNIEDKLDKLLKKKR
jgi:hypothetical protein